MLVVEVGGLTLYARYRHREPDSDTYLLYCFNNTSIKQAAVTQSITIRLDIHHWDRHRNNRIDYLLRYIMKSWCRHKVPIRTQNQGFLNTLGHAWPEGQAGTTITWITRYEPDIFILLVPIIESTQLAPTADLHSLPRVEQTTKLSVEMWNRPHTLCFIREKWYLLDPIKSGFLVMKSLIWLSTG